MKLCHVTAALGVAGVVFLSGAIARSQGADPNIGKDAPELQVKEWITQETIDPQDLQDRPYVLEFWATWCPPCLASIPHLVELSQKTEPFGLPIISLSDEKANVVRPFVEKHGMTYYVGIKEGMESLEYRGIPFAAVIDQTQKVAWAGHPMSPEFEEAIFRAAAEYRPDLKESLQLARKGKLDEAHQALQAKESDAAQQAATRIQYNLKERLEYAQTREGYEKYQALKGVQELYGNMPQAQGIQEQMKELTADPEVAQKVQAAMALEELQAKIEDIQQDAAKIGADKDQQAAAAYFYQQIIPELEAFVKAHPDHPQADSFTKSMPQMRQHLESLQKQEE